MQGIKAGLTMLPFSCLLRTPGFSQPLKKKLLKLLIANYSTQVHGAYRGPLTGVRVCDLSRVLAGPYCTMLLGDMGADVIKVERPGGGDDTRAFGPPFVGGESCYYLSVNRNKRSIAIDMKTEMGRDIIYDLVKISDIFVENYLFGKLDSMGLGYSDISKINPGIVYCSITGYGGRGPDRGKAGYDLVAAAIGGLLNITGPEDGAPCRVGVAVTDIMTGLYAHGAILSALHEKRTTGIGKHISGSLLQTQVAVLSQVASNYLNCGIEGKRKGTRHPSIAPYQGLRTGDGYLIVAAANDGQFKVLCKAIGLPQLLKDERFATNKKRVANVDALVSLIEEKLMTNTGLHWMQVLDDAGIPNGPINNMKQVFDMPQVQALDLAMSIPHPTIGTVKIPGPAVDYDGKSILAPPLHPPLLGEHTTDILRNVLGYDQARIERLFQENVIADLKENVQG